jgi:hypothetical protein
MRPTADAFFCLAEEEDLSVTSGTHAVATLARALSFSRPSDAHIRRKMRELVHAMNSWRYHSPPMDNASNGGRAMGCCTFTMIRALLSPPIRVGFALKCARCNDLIAVAGPGRSA